MNYSLQLYSKPIHVLHVLCVRLICSDRYFRVVMQSLFVLYVVFLSHHCSVVTIPGISPGISPAAGNTTSLKCKEGSELSDSSICAVFSQVSAHGCSKYHRPKKRGWALTRRSHLYV